MTTQKLASIFMVLNFVAWAAVADAQDFSSFDNESELLPVVREIPASNKSANAAGYARLLALNPNKDLYWSKYERYSGSNEAGLLGIVRAIPASNRSANAAGYARLLALDPNNELYRAKFERYSRQPNRPTSVDSVADLKSFLAGSWCVLDHDPTYVAGPYVIKVAILADGNYSLFSKPAAAMSWNDPKQKGTMIFEEGRDPGTGERNYYAVPKEHGSPKLVVGSRDNKVLWQEVTSGLGEASRESCKKYE